MAFQNNNTAPCIFSVIIPAYNAEETLRKTVESAARQSLGNQVYEILIIDDGSTDATWVLMEQLAQLSNNIRIFKNEENRGLGATRNRALKEAVGEYVLFLDADDLLRSDALELFSHDIASHHPEIIYANIKRITKAGDIIKILNRHDIKKLKQKTVEGKDGAFCSTGAVYQKTFLDKHHIMFSEGRFYEDVEFSVKCALRAKNIRGLNHNLYYWIIRAGSITNSMSLEKVRDAVFVFERVYRILEDQGELGKYYKNWKKSAFDFIRLTARRIEKHADGADAFQTLSAALHNAISASEIFRKGDLVDDLATVAPSAVAQSKAYSLGVADIPDLVYAAANAVVMVSLADYHTRNFVMIARRLKALGIKSVILDLSNSKKMSTKRSVTPQEVATFSDVSFFALDFDAIYPLFLNARGYLFGIDWGFIRKLVFDLKEHHIPTFALYEGINDDFLCEPSPRKKDLPYRHTDHLLLPGEYYQKIYDKQNSFVVGLPSIQPLLEEEVVFPKTTLAIINVNFTYGVLEHSREEFLKTAVDACTELGIPFLITQHPADKADLSSLPVAQKTVYETIKDGTFLISRFSTCILEALALGKPVIYHNPHGEKFPKFQQNPMGAFEVSTSTASLMAAIKKVLADLDSSLQVRNQAAAYLQFHANVFSEHPPEFYAASAIKEIVEQDSANFHERILYLAARKSSTLNPPRQTPKPAYSPPRAYFALFWMHQFYRVAALFTRGHLRQTAVTRRRACANQRKAMSRLSSSAQGHCFGLQRFFEKFSRK